MDENNTLNESKISDAQREARERLCAALRSGKYEQGFEKLRTDIGYCCLGVACDLVDCEIWNDAYGKWMYGRSDIYLPFIISGVYGISTTGLFPDLAKVCYLGYEYDSLSKLNDSRKCTFAQIADVIDWQWNGGPKPEGFEVVS